MKLGLAVKEKKRKDVKLLIQTNVIFVGFLIVFLFSLVEVLNKCSVSWLCSMRLLSNIVFHGFVL